MNKLKPVTSFYAFRKQSIRVPRDATILAYIAGLFDGEGCLTSSARTGLRAAPRFQLSITNTFLPVIEWLRAIIGNANLVQSHPADQNKRTKTCYAWRITASRDIEALLSALLPYLIIKRESALDALRSIRNHRPMRRDKKHRASFCGAIHKESPWQCHDCVRVYQRQYWRDHYKHGKEIHAAEFEVLPK